MAHHTKQDFAAMCNLSVGNLGNYIKRKQVIVSTDGKWIDDKIETNKIFLTKRSISKAKIETPAEAIPQVTDLEYHETKFTPVTSKENSDDMNLVLLNKKKIHLENEKREREIAILEVKKQKMHGIVIPTELVKIIFSQHFKAVTAEYQNSADNLLMEIAKRKDFNRNELAELRGQLTDIINIAINKSVDNSKKTIENIIFEYSEKKEVGERQ